MAKKNKEKKIYFSEEIDSRINGIALVFALLVCGVLLQFSPVYFSNTLVTEILKWVFLIVGVFGFIAETSKIKAKIVGLDNVFLGVFFISGWFALFWFVKHWITNSIALIFLLLGAFAFCQGIQQLIYSVALKKSEETKTLQEKQERRTDVIMFLTKLLGVVLVVVQIIKVILDLNI